MEKIAMFSNVPLRRVFSMHDRESIYTIPDDMRSEGLDREVLSVLSLHDRVDTRHEDQARRAWADFERKLTGERSREVTIGLTGKYAELRDAFERGLLPGPRVLTSLSALGNPDETPEALRARVRELAEQGAAVIQIFPSARTRVRSPIPTCPSRPPPSLSPVTHHYLDFCLS